MRTVIRGTTSRGGGGLISGKPGITTQIISGQSGLRHSLRGSGSGKIWKKTVQGKKFEFAGKLREKKNYIMYHSGMGHEKNVIEQFEKLPDPGPKIVEERQVIDNYGYYESKDLKKKKDPRRLSITRHQRLSSPFERTVVKKYEQNTSRPLETKVYTSTTLKNSKFGGGVDVLSKYNKYNSHTSKQKKSYTVEPSKLFETYKPKTTTSYTKTITTTTTNRAPIRTTVNEYTSKTISRLGKPTIKTSKYLSSSSTSKYLNKYEPKSSYIETEPDKTYGLGDTQTKTETTQDGDYLIKITTSKKKLGGDYGSSKYTSSRTKSVPKSTYLESISSVTKARENPSSIYGITETKDNLYEDKVEENIENVERVNEQTLENPETFELSRSEYKASKSSYGGPRPQPTFGKKHGYVSSKLRPGYGQRPVGGLGPRPTLGQGARRYEVISHKPNCPLFEGDLKEDKYRSESQSGRNRYGNNTFSGLKREYSEVKKYSSIGRYGSGDRSFNLGQSSLNTSKKKSKTGSSSKYSYKNVTTTTGSRRGRNYNYYESKDIKKKKKNQPKTTFQYNRSGISSQHQRSSSYNRIKGYKSSNVNNYSLNMPIYTSHLDGTQSARKTTFKLTANKTKKNKGLSSGIASGLNSRIHSGIDSDIRRNTSSIEYRKYEQRGIGGSSSNYGNSSYQNDFRREEDNYGGESKYQYNTEYNRRGDEYRENEENEENYEYQNNEYQNNEYQNNEYQNNEYRNNEYRNNEYQNNEFQRNEYYGEDGRSGDFSSQYQYMDDNEYEVVYCPVHGKQTIRRKRNVDDYY